MRWILRPICWLLGHKMETRIYLTHVEIEGLKMPDLKPQPSFAKCSRCGLKDRLSVSLESCAKGVRIRATTYDVDLMS